MSAQNPRDDVVGTVTPSGDGVAALPDHAADAAPQTPRHRVQPQERLAVCVLVAMLGGIIVWDGTRQIGASASFPLAIGALLVILSLFTLVGFKRVSTFTDEAPLAKGLGGLLLTAGFILLASHIGFLTASILFIPAMAWLGGDRSLKRIVLGVVAFDVAAYVVFVLLFAHPFPAEWILGG